MMKNRKFVVSVTGEKKKKIIADEGSCLYDVLAGGGLDSLFFCDGRGMCGECRVAVKGRNGVNEAVKACNYRISEDTCVEVRGLTRRANTLTAIKEMDTKPDPVVTEGYGIALDLGTTTIAAYLVDLGKGIVVRSHSCLNSQAVYGADIISRIASAAGLGFDNVRKCLVDDIGSVIDYFVRMEGITTDDIVFITAVGNTVMMHFLLGLDVRSLGTYPYTPVSVESRLVKASDLGIKAGGNCCLYAVRCISGYMGADLVSAIASSGMAKDDDLSLLVDMGTNGEICLGNKEGIYACSTAAGPAFEGVHIKSGIGGVEGAIKKIELRNGIKYSTINEKSPAGICGSGVVDAVSELLRVGIIDSAGKFVPKGMMRKATFSRYGDRLKNVEGIEEFIVVPGNMTEHGMNIVITQKDIREVQLAKAAIAAGIRVLMDRCGINHDMISKVYLAGGFGNYMDIRSAAAIGLIPHELCSKTIRIGNAAGAGAVYSLISKQFGRDMDAIPDMVKYVDLAACDKFAEYFIDEMEFR